MREINTVHNFHGYYNRGPSDRSIDKVVIVVGCGGTGGYLIPHLARYISLINKLRRGGMGNKKPDSLRLVLVDGDKVEDKNLVRQQFVRADVNKYKAEVMAKRYSNAFGIDIAYYNGYLESNEDINALIYTQSTNASPILITCVDNNKTRALFFKWYMKRPEHLETFWLDSGNEQFTGQMVIAYKGQSRDTISALEDPDLDSEEVPIPKAFRLPCFFEQFPSAFGEMGLLPTEAENPENCAMRALANPQSISVNMTAAQVLYNALQVILRHEPLGYHMVYFKANTNRITPVRLTRTAIQAAHEKIVNFDTTLKELDLYKVAYPRKRKKKKATVVEETPTIEVVETTEDQVAEVELAV